MSTKDKLNLLLDILNKQDRPCSMSELLEILGPRFAQRSVRRWLAELVAQGSVIRTGDKSGTRYQAYSTQSPNDILSSPALDAIDRVRQPIFKRAPETYHDEWISAYRPNKTFYLSQNFRDTLSTQGKRQHDHEPAGTFAHKIYHRFLIDLTYNSSRLEGNTYSFLETQQLILEGTPAKDKLDLEKVMILNHKEAIRHLVDQAPKLQIDLNEICTLHFLLSDGLVERKYAGQVRDHGVRIGSSTYIPYEDSARLEQQLMKIATIADLIIDPFEQSFFLLTHIAYLQAFIDVNKRTARLSANIPLIKNNLVPLSFNDIEKDDYNSAMICIYELNDTLPLAELYYYSYIRSCQLCNASMISLGFDKIRVQYRQQRREIMKQVILKGLIGNEIQAFVIEQTNAVIKTEDQEAFITAILEDLADLTPARIAGMGISSSQLKIWQRLNKS